MHFIGKCAIFTWAWVLAIILNEDQMKQSSAHPYVMTDLDASGCHLPYPSSDMCSSVYGCIHIKAPLLLFTKIGWWPMTVFLSTAQKRHLVVCDFHKLLPPILGSKRRSHNKSTHVYNMDVLYNALWFDGCQNPIILSNNSTTYIVLAMSPKNGNSLCNQTKPEGECLVMYVNKNHIFWLMA